jgi:hypothetical protein
MTKPRRKPASPTPLEPPQKPTPEALVHGDYTQGDGGARAVWTNAAQNMLGRLYAAKSITKREFAGGWAFTETYTVVWGSGSNRDPLDMGPRGGTVHETEGVAERMARCRARLHTVLNRVGPKAYSMLVSVCVFNESIGHANNQAGKDRRVTFKAALRECATAYGLTEEAA